MKKRKSSKHFRRNTLEGDTKILIWFNSNKIPPKDENENDVINNNRKDFQIMTPCFEEIERPSSYKMIYKCGNTPEKLIQGEISHFFQQMSRICLDYDADLEDLAFAQNFRISVDVLEKYFAKWNLDQPETIQEVEYLHGN